MRIDHQNSTSLTVAVCETVAEQATAEISDLPPLGDILNPEALDRLFTPKQDGTPRSGGQVQFSYAGYTVTVQSDQSVKLHDHD